MERHSHPPFWNSTARHFEPLRPDTSLGRTLQIRDSLPRSPKCPMNAGCCLDAVYLFKSPSICLRCPCPTCQNFKRWGGLGGTQRRRTRMRAVQGAAAGGPSVGLAKEHGPDAGQVLGVHYLQPLVQGVGADDAGVRGGHHDTPGAAGMGGVRRGEAGGGSRGQHGLGGCTGSRTAQETEKIRPPLTSARPRHPWCRREGGPGSAWYRC